MVAVEVSTRENRKLALARGLPGTVEVPGASATVGDLKREIARQYPKLYVQRQRVTVDNKPLEDGLLLSTLGAKPAVMIKDLGPQLSWRAVYIVEYLGPLLIHPLFYFLQPFFYKTVLPHSQIQTIVCSLVVLHFIKRELETIFVHRFSKATMPAQFIIRNSGHYWILAGLFVAYPLYSSTYSEPVLAKIGGYRTDPRFVWTCVAFWTWAQLSNFSTHLTLRSLRPAGTTQRGIPRGYGFGLVSCPNYLFDLMAWLAIAVLTGSWAAYLFLVVASATCTNWALQRHSKYKKEFGTAYPRGRKAIWPMIL